jgi:hypothetical protein
MIMRKDKGTYSVGFTLGEYNQFCSGLGTTDESEAKYPTNRKKHNRCGKVSSKQLAN